VLLHRFAIGNQKDKKGIKANKGILGVYKGRME
jgi:hypothetical protein